MMSAAEQTSSPLDRPLCVTFFPDFAAKTKNEQRLSLRQLAPRLLNTTARVKADLPWLKLALFGSHTTEKRSLRNNENVREISGIEGDYDHEIMSVDEAVQIIRAAGIAALIYTSPSHTDDTPRWRILCPLSRDYPPASRESFLARVNGLFHGALSRESFALSQSYYFGSVRRSPSHRVELIDGDYLDQRADLDAAAIGRPTPPPQAPATHRPIENAGPYCQAVLRSALDRVRTAADGTKHHTLRDQARLLGGFAHAANWTREQIVGELIAALPATAKDLRAARNTAEWGYDAGVASPLEIPERTNVVRFPAAEPPEWDAPPPDRFPDEPEPEAAEHVPPTYTKPALPMLWFDEIEPLLDAQDFVQGVLVEQSAAVVYGESNAGKTFWTTDLALHVAAGMEWNGRRVEQGGVVYCVLEGGRGFRNRVSVWRDAKGVKQIPFAAIPAALNLLHPDADTRPLIDAIKAAAERIGMPVKLVVVDTLSRAMAGGNENAPEDMGALVRNMDLIRQETGACVLFVHHSGKDAAKGARGHSLLRAAIDTEIEVVGSEGQEEKTATVVKQRELSKGDVFAFKLDVVKLGKNRHLEDVTSCFVTPCHAHVPPTRPVRLTDTAQLGLRALMIALDKAGARLPNLPEYPADTWATTQSQWKNEFYQLKGGAPATNRQAFNRAENELLAATRITARNGFVWLVKAEIKA